MTPDRSLQDSRDALADRFDHDEKVDEAVREAVDAAVAHHREKGQPIVVWKDGRATWVDAPAAS